MIKRVKLQRFKKFNDNEIKLSPFSVIMGENSCGKTSIIQAINLTLNTLAKSDLIINKNGRFTSKGKGVGATSLPGLNIADFRELYYGKISRQSRPSQKNFGAVIEIEDDKSNIYRLQISSLFGSFNLKCISSDTELSHNPQLHLDEPLLISGFVGLEVVEQRYFPVSIRQHLSSGNVSSVIRNLVFDLKQNNIESYNKLKLRLKEDFGFNLSDAQFDNEKDMYISANYVETLNNHDVLFDFNSSGSGYMQILQILAPIYSVCPHKCKVVLLDEPDAHLHPNMQIALAKSLQRIQKELGIQFIISTHSAAIIKTVKPNNVIPISAEDPVCEPLSKFSEVEESISKIDNYELAKTVIAGKMVFVEDSNTDILEAFDRISQIGVFNGRKIIPILTGRGKDDKLPFQIKSVLKTFLSKDIDIVFIRDSDGLAEKWKEKLCTYAQSKGIKLHIFSRYEIENYLLEPKVIYNALKLKYPDKNVPCQEKIKAKIQNFLVNTIAYTKYKYDDTLEDNIYKTATLLKEQDYRNQDKVKHEAEHIRSSYEGLNDFASLQKYGMGKETLKQLFEWLNGEGLNLNREDILNALNIEDIDEEVISVLKLFLA